MSEGSLKMPFFTLRWEGDAHGELKVLDQRRLPGEVVERACVDAAGVHDAIRTLAVRGAPAIGVAAAYGVVLGLRGAADDSDMETGLAVLGRTAEYLATSRPTAVNLFWALERMQRAGEAFAAARPGAAAGELKQKLLEEADAIRGDDERMCAAIGRHGEALIPDKSCILTHCNAGALATAGIGTALAPIYVAHANGKRLRVFADETRPLLQGARLTMWELMQAGIEATLICDDMAAAVMNRGHIRAVITGADRIAANGDTANKVGTLGTAILAQHFGIPFYVAAPSSTFDLSIEDGGQIPIEQRDGDEVCGAGTCRTAPVGAEVLNPAFDVTGAELITAIVTEKGILRPPFAESIRVMMGQS